MNAQHLSPQQQAFPRIMTFEFADNAHNPQRPLASVQLVDAWPNAFPDGPITLDDGRIQGYSLPSVLGSALSNNSRVDDGYRFHDAFHIGLMTRLGWSPVMRSLLRVKRRADPLIDEIEDGARAMTSEESLLEFLDVTTIEHGTSMEEENSLGFAALALQEHQRRHSVLHAVPFRRDDIMQAVLLGAQLFHQIHRNLGGTVSVNLDNKSAIVAS